MNGSSCRYSATASPVVIARAIAIAQHRQTSQPQRPEDGNGDGETPAAAATPDMAAPHTASLNKSAFEAVADETPRARRPHLVRLAHELKTPLSAIASAAEIMRDERFGPIGDARYRSYSGDIHQLAQHALDVINRMMALRSPAYEATGGQDRQIVDIDINRLLVELTSALQPIAERSAITLVLQSGTRLPRLVADLVEVRQMLFNILTNALKFTPVGGRVEIIARLDAAGGLDISVFDSGPGMGFDVIERLERADRKLPQAERLDVDGRAGGDQMPSRTSPAGGCSDHHRPQADAGRNAGHGGALAASGLGLGLPLVKRLVGRNGGVLVIEGQAKGRLSGARVALVFSRDRLVFA